MQKPASPVPMLDLKQQYQSIYDEIQRAIDRASIFRINSRTRSRSAGERDCRLFRLPVWRRGILRYRRVSPISLMASGLKPGDEVITTSYSFFATAGAIVRLGARPVFVDIDLDTFNLDTSMLEGGNYLSTKAIIPVSPGWSAGRHGSDHGSCSKIRPGRHRRPACQAIGADYHGRRAGSIGQFGCFSFFPSKNLGGYGDSGMVTCNDAVLADRVRLLRNHGHRPKYYNKAVGGNFRMDALQAAVLLAKLPHLESWTEKRRMHAGKLLPPVYPGRAGAGVWRSARSTWDRTYQAGGLRETYLSPVYDPCGTPQ